MPSGPRDDDTYRLFCVTLIWCLTSATAFRFAHTVPTYSKRAEFTLALRPLRRADTVTIISESPPPVNHGPAHERWIMYKDVRASEIDSFAPRWVHQLRVHKYHEQDHDFFLVGDDDTIFFLENIRRGLLNFNPDIPLFLTDDIGGNCHQQTPRRVPPYCAFPMNSTCHMQPSLPSSGYMHGGFGAVLSRGLIRMLTHEHLTNCEMSNSYGRYCDLRLTSCIRNVGIDVTVTTPEISECKFGRYGYAFPMKLKDGLQNEEFTYLNTTAWTEQLEGHTMDRGIVLRDVKKLVAKLSAISSLGKPLSV